MKKDLDYAGFLRLRQLLSLQHPIAKPPCHDEMQFIIVHQVFELWFKLMLFELLAVREAIQRGRLGEAQRLLNRATAILKASAGGLAVIETMRPSDFLKFRDNLKPASGFQSEQFRELEFLSGSKDKRYLKVYDRNPRARRRLARRLAEPSIWDAFLARLKRSGFAVGSDERTLLALVDVQRNGRRHGEVVSLIEALLDYDEAFSIWRSIHVKMAERMIGSRPGTGYKDTAKVFKHEQRFSASGVEYLKSTVEKRFFPLLWESRSVLDVKR